ncbi:MAG: 50S ribosomal protein L25/general stress protein Ctc [Pseudomonadota bacterium]
MGELSTLSLNSRKGSGTGAARAVRRQGLVPGIIYGAGREGELVSIDPRIIRKGLESGRFFSTLYDATVDNGKSRKVLVRDLQFHPVSDQPQHFDLLWVDDQQRVTVSVPVSFINEQISPGLKAGGVLSVVRREVELIALAGDIPSELICDLAEANLGDTIKISSIDVPSGVEPTITDRDFVICNIELPRTVSTAGSTESTEEEAEEQSETKA